MWADNALNQSFFGSHGYDSDIKDSNSGQKILKPLGLEAGLLLRLQAAADFFTTQKILMEQPAMVNIDIILDPYWLGVLPHTLVPTIAYIAALVTVGFVVSKYVWQHLLHISHTGKLRQD